MSRPRFILTEHDFYLRLAQRSHIDLDTGCWIFDGARNSSGYGRMGWHGGTVTTHRFAYEIFTGPIPGELQLDHLCRNRACWNPGHLDPVTHRVNGLRGQSPRVVAWRNGTCLKGHPATPENSYFCNGRKQCAICARATARARRARRSAA